jgi:hypothetical protein
MYLKKDFLFQKRVVYLCNNMINLKFRTKNEWSDRPLGDGLYKIKRNDGVEVYAVICGNGEHTRIKTLTHLWDSESVNHPIYEGAKFLGPLCGE